MKWQSLIDSSPINGSIYLVAIYSDDDSPGMHWYDVLVYAADKFHGEFLDDHNWVTHFCEIEPIEVEE